MKGNLYSHRSQERWEGKQRRIGLTGGIATGKSSVGNYIKTHKHIPILDADIYAHQALKPNTAEATAVIQRYGKKILQREHNPATIINRIRLSEIIFNDPKERSWLEALLHPYILKTMDLELSKYSNNPILMLIIPLLFEAKLTCLCSEVWLVKCDEKQQYERLMRRDQISLSQAKLKIKSQIPNKEKEKFSDVIIDNSGGKESWIDKVESLFPQAKN